MKTMLSKIAAQYGTPCYVYFRETMENNFRLFRENFDHIHYAVKANSNLAILDIFSRLGAGFDIVSGGELARVLKAGGNPDKIVFSGVGKQADEMRKALQAGIACFNVESWAELEQLNSAAESLHTTAAIALRINPDIPVQTHPYIATGLKENKFGIAYEEALSHYRYAKTLPHLNIRGIAYHLGSQIMTEAPYLAALEKLLTLICQLRQEDISIQQINIGGGFGIDYQHQHTLDISLLSQKLKSLLKSQPNLDLLVEPGRALTANGGILLTKVISIKSQGNKNFAIVDGAMNDLLRPALYDAWHDIVPAAPHHEGESKLYDVVGPVCESGDFFAKNRQLHIQQNDLLAVTMTGAYGFVMSSNYNSRPRAAEVLVDGKKHYLIRERETLADLMNKERCLS
jgi:diaminopimelate decarboxylase